MIKTVNPLYSDGWECNDEYDEWVLRYFDSFNFRSMFGYNYRVFADGATSVTGMDYVEHWKYCELVEDEFDDK